MAIQRVLQGYRGPEGNFPAGATVDDAAVDVTAMVANGAAVTPDNPILAAVVGMFASQDPGGADPSLMLYLLSRRVLPIVAPQLYQAHNGTDVAMLGPTTVPLDTVLENDSGDFKLQGVQMQAEAPGRFRIGIQGRVNTGTGGTFATCQLKLNGALVPQCDLIEAPAGGRATFFGEAWMNLEVGDNLSVVVETDMVSAKFMSAGSRLTAMRVG